MRTSFLKLSQRVFFWTIAMGAFAITASAATLSWGASADESTGRVTGYKVYYSTQSFTALPSDANTNPNFTVVTVPTGQTSVTLNSLVNGRTYYVTVAAYGANNAQSQPSNVVSFAAGVNLLPPSNLRTAQAGQ